MKILSLRGWNYKTGLLVIQFDNYPLINSSSELIIDKAVSGGKLLKSSEGFRCENAVWRGNIAESPSSVAAKADY